MRGESVDVATPGWVRDGLTALTDLVPAALGLESGDGASGDLWDLELLPGSGGGSFASVVYRVFSLPDGLVGASPRSAIAKIIRRQDQQEPSDVQYWRREVEAYASDEIERVLPDGLVLPICHASVDLEECTVLLLEDLGPVDGSARTVEWYGDLARSLGRMNGNRDGTGQRPLWFTTDFTGGEARWAASLIAETVATPPDSIARLFSEQHRRELTDVANNCDRLLATLDSVLKGVAHLDAFSRNVIARDDDLALIDWALVGEAPIGADLAALFVITAVHLDVPSGDLDEFEGAVFDGYVAGLSDVGCPLATDEVRMAFASAVALRFLGFLTRARPLLVDNPDAIAAIVGQPVEEVLAHLVELADHVRPIARESARTVTQ